MVDRNNLNRIKGILSAKQGAEIPKYEGGAKFAMYGGNNKFIYSGDGKSWFTDYNLTSVYTGSMAGFKSTQVPTQPITVPGANTAQGNPNAAVENSAEVIAATEDKKEDAVAEARAKLEPLPQPTQFTHQLNLPTKVVEQNPNDPVSAGINLKQ